MMETHRSERIKTGLQMFNFMVGGDWQKIQSMESLEELLSRIARAGYDGVEWCCFMMNETYMDLNAVKALMDRVGLQTAGLHFHLNTLDTLEADAKQAVKLCLTLDTRYLIFANSTPETFGMEADENGKWTCEQVDKWAGEIDMVLDVLKKAAEGTGIRVLYHNHHTEFLTGSAGNYCNDMITPDGLEADVYWVSKGLDGKVATALDYVRNRIHKIYLLHVKDGLEGSVFTGEMCGWGKGTYDIQSIVDVARTSDSIEWIIIENDAPYNFRMAAIDDAEESAAYLAENIVLE